MHVSGVVNLAVPRVTQKMRVQLSITVYMWRRLFANCALIRDKESYSRLIGRILYAN